MNCKVVLLIALTYAVSSSHGEITQTNESKTNNVGIANTMTIDKELMASNDWDWKTIPGCVNDFLLIIAEDSEYNWPQKGFKYELKHQRSYRTNRRACVVCSTPSYVIVKYSGEGKRRFVVLTKHLYADGEPIKTGWYGCLGKRRVGERVLYVFRELDVKDEEGD